MISLVFVLQANAQVSEGEYWKNENENVEGFRETVDFYYPEIVFQPEDGESQ